MNLEQLQTINGVIAGCISQQKDGQVPKGVIDAYRKQTSMQIEPYVTLRGEYGLHFYFNPFSEEVVSVLIESALNNPMTQEVA